MDYSNLIKVGGAPPARTRGAAGSASPELLALYAAADEAALAADPDDRWAHLDFALLIDDAEEAKKKASMRRNSAKAKGYEAQVRGAVVSIRHPVPEVAVTAPAPELEPDDFDDPDPDYDPDPMAGLMDATVTPA